MTDVSEPGRNFSSRKKFSLGGIFLFWLFGTFAK